MVHRITVLKNIFITVKTFDIGFVINTIILDNKLFSYHRKNVEIKLKSQRNLFNKITVLKNSVLNIEENIKFPITYAIY